MAFGKFGKWCYQQRTNSTSRTSTIDNTVASRTRIYSKTVTLKSKLWVTESRWKWHHSRDHIRLAISRVIWRWIISWPWNVGYRSFKVIENGTIWKPGYGFLFAFYSNYGRICSHLWCLASKNGLTLKTGLGFIQGHWKWHNLIDRLRV